MPHRRAQTHTHAQCLFCVWQTFTYLYFIDRYYEVNVCNAMWTTHLTSPPPPPSSHPPVIFSLRNPTNISFPQCQNNRHRFVVVIRYRLSLIPFPSWPIICIHSKCEWHTPLSFDFSKIIQITFCARYKNTQYRRTHTHTSSEFVDRLSNL